MERTLQEFKKRKLRVQASNTSEHEGMENGQGSANSST